MTEILRILLILTVLAALTMAYEMEGAVIVLKDSDYPSIFKKYPMMMVELYAPWYVAFNIQVRTLQKIGTSV